MWNNTLIIIIWPIFYICYSTQDYVTMCFTTMVKYIQKQVWIRFDVSILKYQIYAGIYL